MTRSELEQKALAYSSDPAAKEAWKDGFKAAMAYYVKEFEQDARKRRKWGTGSALLRGMEVGDVRTVPIGDNRDWRRWRVLCHNFNYTYGVYFKVQLEKTGREEINITRIF